jgi:hypothetical protein
LSIICPKLIIKRFPEKRRENRRVEKFTDEIIVELNQNRLFVFVSFPDWKMVERYAGIPHRQTLPNPLEPKIDIKKHFFKKFFLNFPQQVWPGLT